MTSRQSDGHKRLTKCGQGCQLIRSAPRAANLRVLEIDEIKTVPRAPLSHPFVKRVIATIRREFIDHVLFWDGRDLERKLAEFEGHYHEARGHASLNGCTPLTFTAEPTAIAANLNHVRWVSHCRDLVQLPVAA